MEKERQSAFLKQKAPSVREMNAKDNYRVVVAVPSRLRAVVVTALVSQTRGSLAFLGFGARTLVST